MSQLTWSENDGFDAAGRRVASVFWCFEIPTYGSVQGAGHGPTFVAPRWHWEAFVAYEGPFDRVRTNGKPGTWANKHEAKAAAELAYQNWVRESSSDLKSVAGEDGARPAQGDAIDDQDWKPTGLLGNLWGFVRLCLSIYRPDRKKHVPD